MRTRTFLLLLLFSTGAAAQVAATQPVRLIVPFASGGGTDIGARILAPYLAQALHRPVIVENKPGASGMIGTELVARAAADGGTLLMGTSTTMSAGPATERNLPYNVVKDFVPVAIVATTENLLVVHPSLPVSSARGFVAYAKTHPGQIAYGSSGVGSTYHLGTELFATENGLSLIHVPYKGAAPAVQDLVAGRVQMMMEALYSVAPNVKAGKVRALGIASLHRSLKLPQVPTLEEQGIHGCEFSQWIALFLPAGASPELVHELNTDVNTALRDPEVQERLDKVGLEPALGTPEELETRLRTDLSRWTKVVHEAHITTD
jgi:tripartite-type tricarboxylate transporter receptor subunit TctC